MRRSVTVVYNVPGGASSAKLARGVGAATRPVVKVAYRAHDQALPPSVIGPTRPGRQPSDPRCGFAEPEFPRDALCRRDRSAHAKRSKCPSSGTKRPISGVFER